MNKHQTLTLCAILVASALAGREARAYTYFSYCDGVVTWNHLANIQPDTCTIPTGGTVSNAITSDWANWLADTNPNLGSVIPKNFGCWLTYGDGNNEIMLVNQSTLGSGVNALTTSEVSTCVFSHGTYTESDIISSNALSYSPEDESFWNWSNTQQGPVVIEHELGHFIGLGHTESFDIMRASTPEPVTGGNLAQPYPDDANGARWLYPGGANKTNVFASAQQDVSNTIVATNTPGTINVCRGNNISVTFTVVNPGSVAVNSVGFRVAVTQTPDTGGTNIMTATATSPAGTSFTETHILTVPNVANGVYWIIWQDDTGNTVSETIETDNSVHSAMTINVVC